MIKKLKINNFRNYTSQELSFPEDLLQNVVVLYGENGAGKTNILEAISLFSQTKGLRSAKYEEMINKNLQNKFWSLTLETDSSEYISGYIKGEKTGKRFFKVSDKNVRDLSDFAKDHYVLWMTYETDRLFLQSPSARRDFIDMFSVALNKNHMKTVYDYEKLARERLKILKNFFESGTNKDIANWLLIIENRMAILGIEVAKTRISTVQEIENSQYSKNEFPKFKNEMTGDLESCIMRSEFDDLLASYKSELLARRQKDFFSGSTTFGPNRSDWRVFSLEKNVDASFCSAGEQKMLLIGVFLSFVSHILKTDQRKLILLLDDVIAHLDCFHRKLLFDDINSMTEMRDKTVNVWLSGTSKDLFQDFFGNGMFFEVKQNTIQKG